jgi:malate dehydrogenase (oxaloacetate-decarboxylating)(NADP+)
VLAALRITGGELCAQRFLFLGGGSAAAGIADLLVKAMVQAGLSIEDARRNCWLYDIKGLIQSERRDLAGFHGAGADGLKVSCRATQWSLADQTP